MSNDALERLRKRQRPNVPSRDASLTAVSLDTPTSRSQDTIEGSASTEISTPSSKETLMGSQQPEPLETKQSTLRLEVGLSERLSEVCQSNGISREVLIEALFVYYEGDAQAWQAILAEAQRRGDYRLQMANFKRALSMMQRFT